MLTYPFQFPKIKGTLAERINRFVVRVNVNGKFEEAYLANPGRLWELFLPGTELLLTPAQAERKIPYIVVACQKNNYYILLHTHLTNKVIRHLIDGKKLTAFDGYRVIKEEPAVGRHRFDLLLEHVVSGEEYYLEIKSCTLFSGKIAMFPDAVTTRGATHLLKLKELAASGVKAGCLFVVMNPEVEYFLPAYHIDPDFAHSFLRVKDKVELMTVAIGFDQSFTLVQSVRPAAVPYTLLEKELEDRGSYILIIKNREDRRLNIGSLKEIHFNVGYYIYTGSAMRNLDQRVKRHLRKKKKMRWHIDYLTAAASKVTAVPIVSSDKLECELAAWLHKIADRTVDGFGSSDCRCKSHLFYFSGNPLHQKYFIDFLQHFRIDRLEFKLEHS